MCEKKFLLYETVNSNCNNDNLLKQLAVLTVLKNTKLYFSSRRYLSHHRMNCSWALCCFILFYFFIMYSGYVSVLTIFCRSSLLIPVTEPVTNGHHLFICISFAMVIGEKLVTRVLALAAK